MVALALCSATSLRVFHIFSAWGWMQEFTLLTCHAVSTRIFFCKSCKLLIFLCSGLRSFFWGSSVVVIVASLLVGSSRWVSCSLSIGCVLSSTAHSFGISFVLWVWDSILLSSVGTLVSEDSPIPADYPADSRVGFQCRYKYCNNSWTGVLFLSNEDLPIFSGLFELKFYGWSCIFCCVVQWHFGRSWVVTYVATLTLQCRWFKLCIAGATHYVYLGDSLPVVRLNHCCCCCLFLLFHYSRIFLYNFILFFRQFIAVFVQIICSSSPISNYLIIGHTI